MKARLANPRRFAVLAVILAALLIALLFWARPLIRELIVLPLSYLFWAVNTFFRSTPERYFWAVLLVITGLAAYRSLLRQSIPVAELPAEVFESAYERPLRGQVSLWNLRVSNLYHTESAYLHSTFQQAVGKLLFDTLSHRYHLSQSEIERRLRENSLDVPAAVREYALNSLRRLDAVRPTGFKAYLRGLARQAWSAVTGALRPITGGQARGRMGISLRTQRELEQLEVVLSYMEKDLEVPNDDTGQ